ncbi:MAG: PD40 domain-containing protein [Candidatus Kapabacteria bacterium]|nr:PD40 domain-containing protein [Candidatus Kapabacteria bacterium]
MKRFLSRFNPMLLLLISTAAIATAQPKEHHLANIRQLTFGGDNAEAYFSPDGTKLSFQSNNKAWGHSCDQIHMMDIHHAASDSSYRAPLISTGKGRTTCSYFMPNNSDILYASTHEADAACPPLPAPRTDRKYLWQVLPSYDIYVADASGVVKSKLTDRNGYDAEATLSRKGDLIVFTSDRSGDLELWTMKVDGTDLHQITNELGYDGGAFFSPDGTKLVYRASRPRTEEAQREYKELLAQGLVAPTDMEIFTCNVDGSNVQQITKLGKANWAPFYHPSSKKIIFSSNHASQRGYDFQLYMINLDGTGLEQISSESIFNAFPMFSPDCKYIVWSSNRLNNGTRDTNVFIADWVE